MPKKLTTQEFIEKAKKVHGNKYDYSKVNYIKSSEKVCIICPKHGEFWQIANGHLKGNGCLKCKFEYVASLQRGTKDKFIEKANKIHNNRYNYSEVQYGKNNKEKVCIICPEHGKFWQTPHDHLSGYGCPKCGREKANKNESSNTNEFIEKAKQIHGNKYDYSKVNYINGRTKVIIICKKHNEFLQTPETHLYGSGCPKCQLKSQTKLYEKLKESFPNEEIIYEATNKIVPWLGLQRFDIYFPKYNIAVEYNGEQHYIPIEHFGGKLGLTNTKERDELKRQKCKENNCILFEIRYNYTEEQYNNLLINIKKIIDNYENLG